MHRTKGKWSQWHVAIYNKKKALVIEPIKHKKSYQYKRTMMVYDEAVKLLKNSRK